MIRAAWDLGYPAWSLAVARSTGHRKNVGGDEPGRPKTVTRQEGSQVVGEVTLGDMGEDAAGWGR